MDAIQVGRRFVASNLYELRVRLHKEAEFIPSRRICSAKTESGNLMLLDSCSFGIYPMKLPVMTKCNPLVFPTDL